FLGSGGGFAFGGGLALGGELDLGEIHFALFVHGAGGGGHGGGGGAEVGLTAGAAAAFALGETALDGLDNGVHDDADRLHGVVVARDRVGELGRVGVGVNETDAGDVEALGLGDRDGLVVGIENEHRGGEGVHFEDAGEVFVHAHHLALDGGLFLGGKLGEFAGSFLLLELFELGDGFTNRREIGERAAEPAVNRVGLVGGD